MDETEQNSLDTKIVYKLRYKPRESKVRIFNEPVKVSNIQSKVNTFEKINYVPQGGQVMIESKPLKWNAKPKVNSFEKISYKPGGGDIKIETVKLNWEAKSRISSLLERNSMELYSPRNNQVKIVNQKLDWNNVQAKVNTLDRLNYTPTDDAGQTITYAVEPPPMNLNVKSKISHIFENSNYKLQTKNTNKIKIIDEKLKWEAKSKLNTFEKVNYKPKAVSFKVVSHKIDFSKNAKSKLDTGMDVIVIKKSNDLMNRSQDRSQNSINITRVESSNGSNSSNEPSEAKAWEYKNNQLIFHDINEPNDSEIIEYSGSIVTSHELTNLSKEFLKTNDDQKSLSDKDR